MESSPPSASLCVRGGRTSSPRRGGVGTAPSSSCRRPSRDMESPAPETPRRRLGTQDYKPQRAWPKATVCREVAWEMESKTTLSLAGRVGEYTTFPSTLHARATDLSQDSNYNTLHVQRGWGGEVKGR